MSDAAQGEVGIVNAKRIWKLNKDFWADKNCPLDQELIFASTGTKKPEDPKDKYVSALAGADIQTNPPSTNEAIQHWQVPLTLRKSINFPLARSWQRSDQKVDFTKLEEVLMQEGLQKFADPQKGLLALIGDKRKELAGA